MDSLSDQMTTQHPVALISFDNHHAPQAGPSAPPNPQRQTAGEYEDW